MPHARKLLALVTATIVATTVAACSGSRAVPIYWRPGIPSVMAFAGGDHDLLVRVVGNSFDTSDTALAQSLTQTLSTGHYATPTRFVAKPSPSSRPGYRWIFVFDPSPKVFGPTLCDADIRDPSLTQPNATQDRSRLIAVFCAKTRTMSQVDASFPKTSDPFDPAVTQTFAEIGRLLAPTYDPKTVDDCNSHPKC